MIDKQNIDSFIGKEFATKNGKLTVIGVVGKSASGNKIYSIFCNYCNKDIELYPTGYFTSTKGNLISGQYPCGCSKSKKWSTYEYKILINRLARDMGFVVKGYNDKTIKTKTKVECECSKDKHKWSPTISQLLYLKTGCPKCAGNPRKTPEQAESICKEICEKVGYKFVSFVKPYKNKYSKFEYICPRHGNKRTSIGHFVNNGTRCPECKQGNGNGYYPERKDEQDFLYIVDFHDYIKVGRSFDIHNRKRSLKVESGKSKIKVLSLFTSTHEEVYNLEQKIHKYLESVGLSYDSGWSTETFKNESLDLIYSLVEDMTPLTKNTI